MIIKLFLLGRPGCGKSSAAKHIEQVIQALQSGQWSIQRFKDFDILKEMSQEEQFRYSFKKTSYQGSDGFDVLEDAVLDVALQKLNERLRVHLSVKRTNEIVLIEFARDDYQTALYTNFSNEILQDAHLICIDVDLNTCVQRVKDRMKNPILPDDHYISEETLRRFYVKQNFPKDDDLVRMIKKIDNHGSKQDFMKKIDNVVDDIFKR